MLKFILVLAFLAFAGAILALATAVSSDSQSSAVVDLDLTAIRTLASAADADADNMERHAQSMDAIARAREDHAHWASDAETARANARFLRFLAESAKAIDRDQAAFPVTANAIQMDRLLGDAVNLQSFGQTLIEHASAMEQHAQVMREQAAGDPALLAAVTTLDQDLQRMKADGRAAVDAGKALAGKARTVASSIGVKLD